MKIGQKREKDRKSNPSKLEGRNPHKKLCLVEEQKLLGGSKCHRVLSLSSPLCYGDRTPEKGRRKRKIPPNEQREKRLSDPSLFFILHVLFFRFPYFGWSWSGAGNSTIPHAFQQSLSTTCREGTRGTVEVLTWRAMIRVVTEPFVFFSCTPIYFIIFSKCMWYGKYYLNLLIFLGLSDNAIIMWKAVKESKNRVAT